MATETPETTTPRYAHEIAPPVQPGDDNIAWKAIRFHAARAMAFWQTMTGLGDASRGDGTWAIDPMIAEFTAMRLIAALYQADPSSADETVRDLIQDLDAPQVVGPNIWEQLKACRIDPESIRCYVRDDVLPKERVAPADTPEAQGESGRLVPVVSVNVDTWADALQRLRNAADQLDGAADILDQCDDPLEARDRIRAVARDLRDIRPASPAGGEPR